MAVRGVIFDLDGTLIDSGLDFAGMRREMGLPPGQPILEALEEMSDADRQRCHAILMDHERRGAEEATLMPGVAAFLNQLEERHIPRAVVTRNSRESTRLALSRLGLRFWPVVSRDDAPAKPNPEALVQICRTWQVSASEVLFFGDYLFDIQAGRQAGICTVLYAPVNMPDYVKEADFVICDFSEAFSVLSQFDGSR